MNEGSGQGRIFSSSFSSASFLHARELNQPRMATKSFKCQYEVLDYFRYADNMLFVLEDSQCEPQLRDILQHHIRPYTSKVEEVSSDG